MKERAVEGLNRHWQQVPVAKERTGGIEQARVSQAAQAALGLQKERKIAMTSTVLTVRNTLGSVRLRSGERACGSVGAVM